MKRLFLTLTLTFAYVSAFAVDVTVNRVNDRRTGGSFSLLDISMELPKIKSVDVAASRVLVTAATDETGRDLIDHEMSEPSLETNHRLGNETAATPVTVSVRLKNPDRKASKVSEVRGEIELFMPSKDPNSVAEVAKFLSFSGKPVTHKALKANGIEIAVVSPAQIAAEKKRLGDAKRKEYEGYGYEGENLDNAVSSYLEYVLRLEPSDVVLRMKDPNNRIQEIVYVDAAGEIKRGSLRDDEGFKILTTWGEAPQPDWKLRVSMRTPKNLVRHAFALKDVPLP
ncbi:MAG TPA: hypothetical protein VGQ36_02485 [Thermoanaerobaculia bacterium]|jgi:hypothetical protein|nr:hypothetical protein [Thermoanaerobaculia bacterium]